VIKKSISSIFSLFQGIFNLPIQILFKSLIVITTREKIGKKEKLIIMLIIYADGQPFNRAGKEEHE
jgi:hypothetical protein